MRKSKKMILNTIGISLILFLYFILATNYSLMWFTSMGSKELDLIEIIIVSLISLLPYLVVSFIGIYKKSKSNNISYKIFYIVSILIVVYYVYLCNVIPTNLLNNY